jgi:3-isopropylmalate/(R)-2-methylmalate dehydratase small subunit
MEDFKRIRISGPAVSLNGNDIDTDRIIPARFLRCVTFDGLGEHAFEDDRAQLKAAGKTHAFDDPARQQATVLLVDRNFGCGSSREHAPQALMRWQKGIKVVIGESYAEIFFGNCVALGIPCLTATGADIAKLKAAVAKDPSADVRVDIEAGTATAGTETIQVTMPGGAKKQLVTGRWDSSAELLDGKDPTAKAAGQLPYFQHWQ